MLSVFSLENNIIFMRRGAPRCM
ncbi:hypothetical protein HKBW3S06_00775, partial [Candidatus Hakubella thermalkaliphila]